MTNETLEPGEFVVESWPRLRISIGQVDRRDQNTFHRGLDVAALGILPIARQLVSRQLRFADVRKYRHAIICWLATPDRGDLQDRVAAHRTRRRGTALPSGTRSWRRERM